MKNRVFAAIDLKSFYASVECVERGLNPLDTNLVVADCSRTEKTICLAVSPSLKAYGIPGRARLFEVIRMVDEVNKKRLALINGRNFKGKSVFASELKENPDLRVEYITATPRMAHYIEYSTKVYNVYLKYAAPEDIHVYSIDEVFIDITAYLKISGLSAREFVSGILQDVQKSTGITATAGIGTNLYLAKIAMDIMAKKSKPDLNGSRISELDEMSYRQELWEHTPITDFWRIGRGYAKKLAANGIFTMGDVARCSLGKENERFCEELLYKLFGINAELLIDHAWGIEPCTIADIKAYKPENNSICSGQVLHCPYDFEKAELVLREMADNLALDLVKRRAVTRQLTLTIGYDAQNVSGNGGYKGITEVDRYGRKTPPQSHGSINLLEPTASTRLITNAALELYERIADKKLMVRRINIGANYVVNEAEAKKEKHYEQLDLFTDYNAEAEKERKNKECCEKERQMQQTILDIKEKYGNNAVLKGTSLREGATGKERNNQIGGHRA